MNLNLHQKALFQEFLNPITLKAGKTKCPCCSRRLKAYAKTMDKRLCDMMKILPESFNPRLLFNNDHQKINDFQKLHYWNLIERKKTSGWWKVTERGKRFQNGEIGVPKKLWVFNNKVILQEDERVDINGADVRWQQCREDYTQDYVPHKPEVKFIIKDGVRVAEIT